MGCPESKPELTDDLVNKPSKVIIDNAQELQEFRNKNKQLAMDLDHANTLLTAADSLKSENQKQSKELQASNAIKEEAIKKANDLEARLKQLNDEQFKVKTSYDVQTNTELIKLQSELKANRDISAEINKKLEENKAQLGEKDLEINRIQNQLSADKSYINAKLEEGKNANNQLQAAINELKLNLSNANKEIELGKTKDIQIAQLQNEILMSTEQLKTSKIKETTESDRNMNEIARLKAELNASNQEKERASQEIEHINNKLNASISDGKARDDALTSESKKHLNEVLLLKESIAEMGNKIKVTETSEISYKSKYGEVNQKSDMLEQEKKKLEDVIRSEKDKAKIEKESLKVQLKEKEEENNAFTQKINEALNENKKLAVEMATINNMLSAAKDDAKSLLNSKETEISKLQSQLKAEINSHNEERKKTKLENESLTIQLKAKEEENNAFIQKINETLNENKKLTAEIAIINNKLGAAKDDAKNKLNSKEGEIFKLQSQLKTANDSHNEEKARLEDQLKKQIELLDGSKAIIEEYKAKEAQLKGDIEKLKEKPAN